MARKKKKAEQEGISAGWINTFADLMNLLLCFFVLLFSMSTVDADKYEQLVTSMTERINIFDGGGAAVGEGAFVSSGTDQLVSISEYFNEYENSGEDNQKSEEQVDKQDGNKSEQGNQSTGEKPMNDKAKAEEGFLKKQQQEQKEKAEKLYKELTQDAEHQNVEDQININMDKKYQFVQISLNGALLFESGDIEFKKNMVPLMSKVGDILKRYADHRIKIEGHTDNVPISGRYKNNMMLSTALAEMMDNTECIIFFNTPNAINLEDELNKINGKNKEITTSPWIYHELSMTTMLQRKQPKRSEMIMEYSSRQSSCDLKVKYDVTKALNKMINLEDNHMEEWYELWNKQTKELGYKGEPLDTLYEIVFPQSR